MKWSSQELKSSTSGKVERQSLSVLKTTWDRILWTTNVQTKFNASNPVRKMRDWRRMELNQNRLDLHEHLDFGGVRKHFESNHGCGIQKVYTCCTTEPSALVSSNSQKLQGAGFPMSPTSEKLHDISGVQRSQLQLNTQHFLCALHLLYTPICYLWPTYQHAPYSTVNNKGEQWDVGLPQDYAFLPLFEKTEPGGDAHVCAGKNRPLVLFTEM